MYRLKFDFINDLLVYLFIKTLKKLILEKYIYTKENKYYFLCTNLPLI